MVTWNPSQNTTALFKTRSSLEQSLTLVFPLQADPQAKVISPRQKLFLSLQSGPPHCRLTVPVDWAMAPCENGYQWYNLGDALNSLLALFHCMVRHGTVRYGSLLGGFPLGTVPGTWYFFSTTSVEVPSSRTVTKTWRVNSADHWMAGENRHYCVTELATRDPPLPLYPLDLNQHSQRRIGRNFCLNKRTFLHQPQNSSVVVCWGSSDVPLVDSRGADPARAWWRDAEGKALCI